MRYTGGRAWKSRDLDCRGVHPSRDARELGDRPVSSNQQSPGRQANFSMRPPRVSTT